MSKSVYSLVLSDDIIRAADAMAYKLHISRSALIDRILAEKLAVQTPQLRMRDIMENIGRFFDDDIFVMDMTAQNAAVVVRTPLPFKYNPTIRYSVEFSRNYETLGRLKVNFRTRNTVLLMTMDSFVRDFFEIEAKYLSKLFTLKYETESDRLIRVLNAPIRSDGVSEFTADELAEAIADYVSFFDRMIKLYFEYSDSTETAKRLMNAAYLERMKNCRIYF